MGMESQDILVGRVSFTEEETTTKPKAKARASKPKPAPKPEEKPVSED